jgi:hypothetical protein
MKWWCPAPHQKEKKETIHCLTEQQMKEEDTRVCCATQRWIDIIVLLGVVRVVVKSRVM